MAVSTEELFKKFNPNDHLMEIESGSGDKKKKNDYLPVQYRLVWFRALCPQGTIETSMLHLDLETEFEGEKWIWDNGLRKNVKVPTKAKGIAIFHAVVKDGQGGSATGTKSEKGVDFPDFIEKAETGAIGRALAALGYGTQFTGDELDEGKRIADSPVDRGNEQGTSPQKQQPKPLPARSSGALANPEQISNIRALIEKQHPHDKVSLEDLYLFIIKRDYPGDDALPVGEWARLYREVAPKQQAS